MRIRPIPQWPGYFASDAGQVLSTHRGTEPRLLRPYSGRKYVTVVLYRGGNPHLRQLHNCVLEAFVGPRPDGYQGCHGDGDTRNNTLLNLRWDTPSGNAKDKIAHGTHRQGETASRAKLTEGNVVDIRKLAGELSTRKLAARFGVGKSTITQILDGKTWKHLPPVGDHARRRGHGTWAKRKLTSMDLISIMEQHKTGVSQSELARRFGVRQSTVWAHLQKLRDTARRSQSTV